MQTADGSTSSGHSPSPRPGRPSTTSTKKPEQSALLEVEASEKPEREEEAKNSARYGLAQSVPGVATGAGTVAAFRYLTG
ncbi:hypothetical protein ACN28S_27545 [Cystobacter fuscus]